MVDPFNLQRFIDAQASEIDGVRAELRDGCKRGHWMWFIFPQLKGLGSSWTANYYAISCRAEAAAYLAHSILGSRLIECTELVNLVDNRPVVEIFGYTDALKFRSSITLFAEVSPATSAFTKALGKFFSGEADRRTLDLLQKL